MLHIVRHQKMLMNKNNIYVLSFFFVENMNTTVEYKTLLEEMKSLHEAIDEIKSLLIGTHNVETKNENEAGNIVANEAETKAENNERASCNICGKKYANKYILATHMKTVHNPERISYTCDKCNKSFKCKQSYEKHKCKQLNNTNENEIVVIE